MDNDVTKEYSNGELTVVWKPALCIHSGICVKLLPSVYNPEARPWIKAENADTEALRHQIEQCPSGALSYYLNKTVEHPPAAVASTPVQIKLMPNGPLVVPGPLQIIDAAGNSETKEQATAFCRCGHSQRKPYCDGSHQKVDFRG